MAAFVLCLASGCATYEPRPIDIGTIETGLENRRLEDPALTQWLTANAPPGATAWDLDRLSWTALYYHADLQVARARWQSARAAAITAGARPNPQLELTFEHNRDAAEGEDPWTRGFSLAIPLDLSGKRRARLAVAVAKAEQARLEYVDAAWAARKRVRDSMLGLMAPADALQAQLEAQTERVRLMQRRVELGLAGRPELAQLQLSMQQLGAEAADARRELAESRATLAAAIGVPVEALQGHELDVDAFAHPLRNEQLPAVALQRQALQSRPDVHAALAAYAAAEANLRLEVANQYPDLSLSPGLLWDAGAAKWTLGAALVLPLLNRNEGPIEEAKAQREEAAARVLQAQANALAELDQARAGYAAALDAYRAAEASLAKATALLEAANRAQTAGTGIRSDVLSAMAELSAARARLARALVAAERALGAVEDAVRAPLLGPSFSPESVIAPTTGESAR